MRRLVLIRHSLPVLDAHTPVAEWHLCAEGVARAERLAARLRPGTARRIFTSRERKALETATTLAREWSLPVEEVDGLHEHERPEPGLVARDVFEGRIRELFAHPAERVFGAESAAEARRRFTKAAMRIVTSATDDILVVSHGTVITLFVAEATGVEPFAFWKGLTLPCAVTLTLPELRLEGTEK